MAAIGGLMRFGASKGGDAWIDYAATSVSHDPESARHADGLDVARGVAFGSIVFAAGLASGALGYLIWKLTT